MTPQAPVADRVAQTPMQELRADFVTRFRRGPAIIGQLALSVDRFSILALYGPSGSGKSTMLRSLAGLERPDSGTIAWGDQLWFDAARRLNLPPQRRGVGLLFQDYALFPHLTVAQNIAFGIGRQATSERSRRVAELVELFQLQGLEARRPGQISGGQQQRVALARTVAPRPRLLCLDEPLSALDAPTRAEMRLSLRRLLAELQLPTILVTHDLTEALTIADALSVVCDGRVEQTGVPREVLQRPANARVARVMGYENVLPARVLGAEHGKTRLAVGAAEFVSDWSAPAGECCAAFRSADVVLLSPDAESTDINVVRGTVTQLVHEESQTRVVIRGPVEIQAVLPGNSFAKMSPANGDTLVCGIPASRVCLLPA